MIRINDEVQSNSSSLFDCNSTSLELFSLKDIILEKEPKRDNHELFFKLPDEPNYDENSMETALVLRRTRLQFKGKKCIVLNFQDITHFYRQKMEQDRREYMSTIYSIVHHEMIGPLKNNVILADQLMKVST